MLLIIQRELLVLGCLGMDIQDDDTTEPERTILALLTAMEIDVVGN